MSIVGVYRSPAEKLPFKTPCEARYVLSFDWDDTLPRECCEITLLFHEHKAQARLIVQENQVLVVSCQGPGVSGIQQLGSIMGLRHGDQIMLRREDQDSLFSVYRL
jgi:hypothetical protein